MQYYFFHDQEQYFGVLELSSAYILINCASRQESRKCQKYLEATLLTPCSLGSSLFPNRLTKYAVADRITKVGITTASILAAILRRNNKALITYRFGVSHSHG